MRFVSYTHVFYVIAAIFFILVQPCQPGSKKQLPSCFEDKKILERNCLHQPNVFDGNVVIKKYVWAGEERDIQYYYLEERT